MFVYFILTIFVLYVIFAAWLLSPKPAHPVRYVPRDPGNIYKTPPTWKGTPVDRKNRFLNHEYPFYINYLNILIWVPSHLFNLMRNQFTYFKVMPHSNAEILNQKDTLIWLGHASFFLNLNGVKILIDPHFYNTFLYKRHSSAPVAPDLFSGIDYILLSHDHADHFCEKSLKQLILQNSKLTFLAGLKMDYLISKVISQQANILTADWYQKYFLKTPIDIFFVPSRHYSRRIGHSFNEHLWGGFIISYKSAEGNNRTIYFGGDSGSGNHFCELNKLFSPDLAILGIGAYKPGWFMHPNHMSPTDALKAFDASGASVMIPMHYGTFNLSNELMANPLKELLKNRGSRKIVHLTPGESFKIA